MYVCLWGIYVCVFGVCICMSFERCVWGGVCVCVEHLYLECVCVHAYMCAFLFGVAVFGRILMASL